MKKRLVAVLVAFFLPAVPVAAEAASWPGPGAWTVTDQITPNGGCAARLAGPEVDTLLSVNQAGRVLLSAGRPDWSIPPGEVYLDLQIGEGAPARVRALAIKSIVLVLLSDEKEVELKAANQLRWYFPTGTLIASIPQIEEAIIAVRACHSAQSGQRQ